MAFGVRYSTFGVNEGYRIPDSERSEVYDIGYMVIAFGIKRSAFEVDRGRLEVIRSIERSESKSLKPYTLYLKP